MIYKSCPWLEHGLYFDKYSVYSCCDFFNQEKRAIIPLLRNYSPEFFDIEQINQRKKVLRNHNKKGNVLPSCENCSYLVEKDWDEDDYINLINISHWRNCNCNCFYCSEQERKFDNPQARFNLLPVFEKLKNAGILKGNGEIFFTGGEVTVLKEFNDLMRFFLYDLNAQSIFINSSGILFNEYIERGISENRTYITVSTDCGTRNLYKKIKQQDTFDAVVSTLKKYVAAQPAENKNLVRIKYIILPKINSNKKDIDDFMKLALDIGIHSVLIDVEIDWYIKNQNKIDNKYYDLINYAQEKAQHYGLDIDYYFYAKNLLMRKQ